VIALSAIIHTASRRKAKGAGNKAGLPKLWWLRVVQLGFGLLCLIALSCLSTPQERNFLCFWLVLMSLTPVVAGVLSFFGIKSVWVLHALVVVVSIGCLAFYLWLTIVRGM
ncbi:MAG: hypothetical protein WCD79_15250, partial [Chthoniobacteraceae bacterium]